MKAIEIPTSLRTALSELKYQEAKKRGQTRPLQDEPALIKYKLWNLIANRYPYNLIYITHDMLVPVRTFANRKDMNLAEFIELNEIIDELSNQYDLVFENLASLRSIQDIYHLHMARQKPRDPEPAPEDDAGDDTWPVPTKAVLVDSEGNTRAIGTHGYMEAAR